MNNVAPKNYFIELCLHLKIFTRSAWTEFYTHASAQIELPYPPNPEKEYKDFCWGFIAPAKGIDTKINYKHASFLAQYFNITSQREWASFIKTTAGPIGFPVPTNAPVYYKARGEWSDWSDFLKTKKYSAQIRHDQFISYEDAVALLETLDIKTASDYRDLVKSGFTGSQLPSNPNVAYSEWISWNDFLAPKFLPYAKAKAKVRECGITTRKEFQDNRPDRVPSAPFSYYKKHWKSWQSFLSREVKSKVS